MPRFKRRWRVALLRQSLIAFLAASLLASSLTAFAESPAGTEKPLPAAPLPSRLPSSQFKGGEAVLQAFRPVATEASHSTVRILSATAKKTDGTPRELALGTVVDAAGLVVSKASQLEGDLLCWLGEARVVKATVVASDVESDLALVRVEASGLTPVRWADRTPQLGQWLATASVSDLPIAVGIVSAATRVIPSHPGVLGVAVTDDEAGPKVSEIIPGSGAAKAGIQKGDVILEVGGKNIADGRTLATSVGAHRPGTKLTVKLRRNEKELSLEATLTRRPGEGPSRIQFQNSLGGELSVRRDGFASALQHDTVLRPEDCGGPAVGLDGKAVGINIARAGRTETYLLPYTLVQEVVKSLRAKAN